MRGRKPKPAVIAEAEGIYDHNPGRRNTDAPTPTPGSPDKPEHLTGIAAEKWDELAGILVDMEVVTTADRDMMELYCVTYAAYREALANVARTGQVLVIREEKGSKVEVKRNPFSTELHRYADRMSKLLTEMGLTPSSRTRVKVHEPAEANPLKMYEAS